MNKGIVLIAVGKRGYGFMAYNMAFSIKHYNPDLHITLFHDEAAASQLHEEWKMVFDVMIPLDESMYFHNGTFDPCKLKTNLYEILPYENNLYLDVDGVALKDIEPLLDSCIEREGYYYTYIIREANSTGNFIWASPEEINTHFNLPPETKLNATQTSIQFIKKCDEAKAFYDRLKQNYANPLPLNKLRYSWGGGQPDELYINVTLAQAGIEAEINNNSIFFGGIIDVRPQSVLKQTYYILSIYGGRSKQGNTQTRPIYWEWYDNEMLSIHRAQKKEYVTKSVYFKPDKWANNDRQITQVTKVTNLQSAKLLIADSIKIDSSKLIREYPGPQGEKVLPSNWFNCSIIEYRDKVYMAYRMENRPWCTRTKIGLCELDENFQPKQETNSLLELHSDLKVATMQGGRSFPKGFHVEDPRLFIYNGQLMLSYTDGYQMGQATINTETLQAYDSFYIDKPQKQNPEKNWTFFEHNEKLMSVYWTSPHTVFEMNGSQYENKYRQEFKNNWQWGVIRGGTSPMRYGDYYLSFFHSATDILYKGMQGRQYFMGAYLFEAQAPFTPVAVSKEPLITGEIIQDSIPRLSNKIFVVFPSGMIHRDDSWFVSFGYNDYECRVIEITDIVLKENLTHIKKIEYA